MSPFHQKLIPLVCLSLTVCCCFFIHHRLFVPDIFDAPDSHDIGQLRQHGDYWVWHNYLRAELNFVGNDSVTLTTHGSYPDLAMLLMLVYRWQGPVSITLYVNNEDFDKTFESLSFINACLDFGDLVRRFVTVHLCFHQDHVPPALDFQTYWNTPSPWICAFEPLFLNGNQTMTYWYQHRLSYPVNLLRNVARLNAPTHFVMPLDIDLLPTQSFPQKFLQFIEKETRVEELPERSIYCLPTFVHDYVSPLPNTKAQLREVLRNSSSIREARGYDNPMRQKLWLENDWYVNRISIFEISVTNDMCVGYVTVNTLEPLYDEPIDLESIFEMPYNAHSLVLNLLNFTFVNLDGAFLFRRANNSWQQVDTSLLLI